MFFFSCAYCYPPTLCFHSTKPYAEQAKFLLDTYWATLYADDDGACEKVWKDCQAMIRLDDGRADEGFGLHREQALRFLTEVGVNLRWEDLSSKMLELDPEFEKLSLVGFYFIQGEIDPEALINQHLKPKESNTQLAERKLREALNAMNEAEVALKQIEEKEAKAFAYRNSLKQRSKDQSLGESERTLTIVKLEKLLDKLPQVKLRQEAVLNRAVTAVSEIGANMHSTKVSTRLGTRWWTTRELKAPIQHTEFRKQPETGVSDCTESKDNSYEMISKKPLSDDNALPRDDETKSTKVLRPTCFVLSHNSYRVSLPLFANLVLHPIYQADHTADHQMLDNAAHITCSMECKIPCDKIDDICPDHSPGDCRIEKRTDTQPRNICGDAKEMAPDFHGCSTHFEAERPWSSSSPTTCTEDTDTDTNRDRHTSVGVYPTHAVVWTECRVFLGFRLFTHHDYAVFLSQDCAMERKRELEARNDVGVVVMYSLERKGTLTYYMRMPLDVNKPGISCDHILAKRRKWKRYKTKGNQSKSVLTPKKNNRDKKKFRSWHNNCAFRAHCVV